MRLRPPQMFNKTTLDDYQLTFRFADEIAAELLSIGIMPYQIEALEGRVCERLEQGDISLRDLLERLGMIYRTSHS